MSVGAVVVLVLAGWTAGNIIGAVAWSVMSWFRNRRNAAWPDWQEWSALELTVNFGASGDAERARAITAMRKLRERHRYFTGGH